MTEYIHEFPSITKVNYLNTASIGLIPNSTLKRMTEFIEQCSLEGTLFLDEERERQIYEDLRESVSLLLNCGKEEVAIFTSVTEALNAIAWSLYPFKGNVISTSIEFPSVTYPWIRVAQIDKEVNVNLLDAKELFIDTDELLNLINDETKVVSISHVEYLTGQINDIKKISRCARDVGAAVIVDGIQAAGYLPVNVRELDVDVYIIGGYKWLLGPFGAAAAYISKRFGDKIYPALVGWRTPVDIWKFDANKLDYANTARKFEFSTTAYYSMIGMDASIQYLLKIGISKIYRHNKELVSMLEHDIKNMKSLSVIPDRENIERGSIITIKVDNPDILTKEVRKLKRPIEYSIRNNLVRISPHIYNTYEDISHLTSYLRLFYDN
jgi:selenocysteine lyase/cysteine desulfurase